VSVDNASSSTVFVVGVAAERASPNSIPRVGVDYIFAGGLSVGAAAGVSSIHTSAGPVDESIAYYTFAARVGYRLALGESVDFTPRAGFTVVGLSAQQGSTSASGTIYGADLDAPFAFRLTPSFNILLAPELVRASGDSGGFLWSLQGWVGMGGYL
jgi:hypothetical protein